MERKEWLEVYLVAKIKDLLIHSVQGVRKREKARLKCSWTTAPSPFTLGAKPTHRPLRIV